VADTLAFYVTELFKAVNEVSQLRPIVVNYVCKTFYFTGSSLFYWKLRIARGKDGECILLVSIA
jgi:hypothetical protein